MTHKLTVLLALLLTTSFTTCTMAQNKDKFWFPTGMFSELPHERAELLDGFSGVNLPVTTDDETAQKFFQQGLAHLYCDDELEAARAFREVITRDPECALGYWGISQSCETDWSRQTEYMWYAVERRKNAKTQVERDLIDAYSKFYGTSKKPEMVVVDPETGKRRARPMTSVDSRGIAPRRDTLANDLLKLARKYPKQTELLPLTFKVRPQIEDAVKYMSQPPAHPVTASLVPWHKDANIRWLDCLNQRRLPRVWNGAGLAFFNAGKKDQAKLAFEAAVRLDNAWLKKWDAMPYERHGFHSHRYNLTAGSAEAAISVPNSPPGLPKHPQGAFRPNSFYQLTFEPIDGSPAVTEAQSKAVQKLGPLNWTPPAAPDFILPRGKQQGTMSIKDFGGKPTLVVFYLGFGCIHCVEQLNELRPRYKDFKNAGIEIVAIGTDDPNEVKAAIQDSIEIDGPQTPFEILCDPKGETFKAFHCWDEFTDEALHGTFLIDGKGKVRWRDISEEPFMDTDYLLKECQRLTSQAE